MLDAVRAEVHAGGRLRQVVLPGLGLGERPPTDVLVDGPVLDVCAGTALLGMPS